MEFTYKAYNDLLCLLKNRNYEFSVYGNDSDTSGKAVIMRHDIDFSPEKAIEFSKIEKEQRIKSIYFVLLRTNFYNVMEKNISRIIRQISFDGHDIGLHFDETQYDDLFNNEDYVNYIIAEKNLLSDMLELPVNTVSMHRPSEKVLSMDLSIPGMVNTYSNRYFRSFKYFSDSSMRWREDVLGAITEDRYDRLHILTHPFWYNKEQLSRDMVLSNYINAAKEERTKQLEENITMNLNL